MKKIGIVAGNGHLPFIAAKTARKEGHAVYIAGIRGEVTEDISAHADELMWIKLGELKKLASFFLEHEVTDVCFEGKITKTSIFKGEVKPDLDMIILFAKLKNNNDDTILGAICDYLEKKGIHIIDSTTFLDDCFPGSGVLTRKKLSRTQKEDVAYGWKLAKENARLDVGQSVVVKDRTVLAVEAIEGTDEAIRRGGTLGNKGVVIVKVAKPNQDMRFDVPTIGPHTVQSMKYAGAEVLAFEAGKTIVVDREAVVQEADEHGMIIVGITEGDL